MATMKRVMIPKGGMNEDGAMDLRGKYRVVSENMSEMILMVPENEAGSVAASNGGMVEMDEG